MMEPIYKIIFEGRVLPGKDAGQAKKILEAIFKKNADKVIVPLSGGRPYVQGNLTLAMAKKFKAAFDRAGAAIRVVRSFKCSDCGHVQKSGGQCNECMNLQMESTVNGKASAVKTSPASSAKKLNQYATYKIVFNGEIQPNADVDQVKKKLARLFKNEVFKVNAPFAGGDPYMKGRLNSIDAQKILDDFKSAGALVSIVETVTCPGCGAILDKGQACSRCRDEEQTPALDGVSPMPEPTQSAATFGQVVEAHEEQREKAVTRLRRGAIVLALVFCVNHYIFKNPAYIFDWHYWLSTPYFVSGCYYLAKSKNYSIWLLLLGLANLLGVGVMLFLPDRSPNAQPGRFLNRDRLMGLVCAALLLTIPINFYLHNLKVEKYFARLSALEEKYMASDNRISLDGLVAELEQFFDLGLKLLAKTKPKALEYYPISESILSTMENFFIQMQYQQFLQIKDEKEITPDYTDENIKKLKEKIFTSFEQKVRTKRTALANMYFEQRQYVTHSISYKEDSPLAEFMNNLRVTFGMVERQLEIFMKENSYCRPVHSDQLINPQNYTTFPKLHKSIPQAKLEELADISVNEDGIITLTIRKSSNTFEDVWGQTVMFVPIKKDVVNRRGKVLRKFKIMRVGGTLPDCYLESRCVFGNIKSKLKMWNSNFRGW